MRRRWLTRAAVTVGLGVIVWVALSMAGEAEADDGTGPAQVASDCSHGGPYQDQDVWVFDTTKVTLGAAGEGKPGDAAEGKPGDAGEGTPGDAGEGTPGKAAEGRASATFEGPEGQTEARKISGQVYDLAGHSVAWTSAPAGWHLVGTNPEDLRVVGTCKAEPVIAATPSREVAAVVSRETLPQTGQDVGAMVTVGSALVISGGMLLFVRRRRPSPPAPRHRASDRVWTYPS